MTGIDPDWTERRRDWAAEQLGLAADAPATKVRDHFLRHLSAEEFVPSTEERQALTLLLGRDLPEPRQAQVDHAIAQADAERLQPEVENFASHFWNLSPPDRRKRWIELLNQCATVPALQRRLQALEAGLDHVPGPEAEKDWCLVELGRQVREGFVLSPAQQARARQAFLAGIENGWVWKPAVSRLRSAYPLLASLAPDLLEKILTTTSKPVRLPKSAPAAATATSEKPKQSWHVLIYLVLVICGGLARALTISNPSRSTPLQNFPAQDNRKPWDDIINAKDTRGDALKRLMGERPNQPAIPWPDSGKDKTPAKDQPKDRKFP